MDLTKAIEISRRSLAGEAVDIADAKKAYDVIAAWRSPTEDAQPGLPVAGYKEQPMAAVRLVNMNKHREERLLRIIDDLIKGQDPQGLAIDSDPRWLAIARTHLEQGFMALNRAIFKPERIQGEI
jgi:hypothetical protein